METLAIMFFVVCLVLVACVFVAGLIKTAQFEYECEHRDAAVMPVLVAAGMVCVALFDASTGSPLLASVAPFVFVLRHARDWRENSVLGVYVDRDDAEYEDRQYQARVRDTNGINSYMPTVVEPVSIDNVFRDYGATGNNAVQGFVSWADSDVQGVVSGLLGDSSELVDEIAYIARQLPLFEEIAESLFNVTGNTLETEIHTWLESMRDDLLEELAKDRRVLEYLLTEHCESISSSFGQYVPDRILDLVGKLEDLETLTTIRDLLADKPDDLDLNDQLMELWEPAYEHARAIGYECDWWVADTELIASLVNIGIAENWG